MSKKKRRKPHVSSGLRGIKQLDNQLDEVQELLADEEFEEAAALLTKLERLHPRDPLLLRKRLSLAFQAGDLPIAEGIAEKLNYLDPNDGDVVQLLAGIYLQQMHFALALKTFRKFVERWPDNPEVPQARSTIERLEAEFPKELQRLGLGGPDGFDLAIHHEQTRKYLQRGDFPSAIRSADQLLKSRPKFVPARNNLAECFFRQGNYAHAINQARQVLEIEPGNIHALSNLVRFLALSGQSSEAASIAHQLRAVQPANADQMVKVAEALSVLGDDAGILAATETAEQEILDAPPEIAALLEHFAAVAACRLGREDDARHHWKEALGYNPNHAESRNNLDDLDLPPAERNGPWALPLSSWLPKSLVEDLATRLKSVGGKRGNKETKIIKQFVQAFPHMEQLAPMLVDRGDPGGRAFALHLAETANTPSLLAALADFAKGQRGTDKQRSNAARLAIQARVLKSPVRLWMDGQWRDQIQMLSFEIHEIPKKSHSPEVEALIRDAIEALQIQNDPHRAEDLLRKAIVLEPNAPDVQHNLATAYLAQGRDQAAQAMMRDINARHPDYWFSKIAVAQMICREGKTDEAEAILLPLLNTPKMHASEFTALMMGMMDLMLAKKQMEGAKTYWQMWADVQPHHPQLAVWRDRINGNTGWRKWLPWRR